MARPERPATAAVRALAAVCGTVLCLVAAACGATSSRVATASLAQGGGAVLSSTKANALDLATGATVPIAGFASSTKPVLMWFWTPWCPYCNQEASDVERFARDHRATLVVVGIGTGDDVANAKAFSTRYAMHDVRMLWDPSAVSWGDLGVATQPSAILFDTTGHQIGAWFGGFDPKEVLDLVARL